ncbi:MAG: amino acid adenylation domain-containing protein, partial [Dehalococcoidia bacterium]
LEQSLVEILRRHEVLRSSFQLHEGSPVLVIAPAELELVPVDLQDLPAQQREEEARHRATQEYQRPFDLSQGPLFRGVLYQLEAEHFLLVLVVHHIAFDGWSQGVMTRELSQLYQAFSSGLPASLADLPVQYADYAQWQRDYLQGEVLEEQLAYWRNQLGSNLTTLELPTDRPRPPTQSYSGSTHYFELPTELASELNALGREQGATLFMVLLAAFQALLHRYSRQEDIVVGSPISGRNQVETEELIGCFINTLVLRTDLSGNPTARELIQRVRNVTLDAFDHQELPFEKLVEELHPERDLSRNPLFQVMFTLHNAPVQELELAGLAVEPVRFEESSAQVDLSLGVTETAGKLKASFNYSTDLFDADTVEGLGGHFRRLLESIVQNPDQRVLDLPILTEPERTRLLVEWNQTQADYPSGQCLHQLFQQQAEQTPDSVAVIFEEQQLSYGQLHRRSNQVAHYLRGRGVAPGELVGISLERSPDMVVGLLGILKAGGAYLPLDPEYPRDRLDFILQDASVSALLTRNGLAEGLQSKVKLVNLDRDQFSIDQQSDEDPDIGVDPKSLAYVIYTSGSTGIPKGVQVPHRALVNCLCSMSHQPGLTEQDVLLSVTSLSFDIAALELFLPLITGAQLLLVSHETSLDGYRLQETMEQDGASVMQATPATWRLLLQADWLGNPQLKILCGGEVLPSELAGQLLERCASLWNMYGPTETTIWSTVHQVDRSDGPVPIGRPIANTQLYVLDSQLQPVPIGVSGELHIGGDGLAHGYLDRPELTAEKFLPN